MRNIRAALWEMLRQALHDQEFALPVHLAMVGANGSSMVLRYAAAGETLESRVLVQHIEADGTFHLPIAIVISDSAGRMAMHEYRPAESQGTA